MSEIVVVIKNDTCCICLMKLDACVSVFPCEHQVHTGCMIVMLNVGNSKLTCPLCRKSIVEETKEPVAGSIEAILAHEKKLEQEYNKSWSLYRKTEDKNDKFAVDEFVRTKNVKVLYKPYQLWRAYNFGLDEVIKTANKEELEYLYKVLVNPYLCKWHHHIFEAIEARNLVEIDYIAIWEKSWLGFDDRMFKIMINKPSVVAHLRSKPDLEHLSAKQRKYYNKAVRSRCVIM